MAITTNYDNRDVDLLIFQQADPFRESKIYLGLDVDGEGKVCTGIQKVAQSFLVLFLTDKGSNPWDPTRGSDFMPALRSGQIYDDDILQAEFRFAVLDVGNYIRDNTDIDTTPEDEQFDSATLMSWDINNGKMTLYIRVQSVAGESKDYIVPVPVAIR